jgi:hypothetical protein
VKESGLEKRLRLAVEKAGGKCFKLPAWLYRGIPDRMVLLPMGRIFFIELKSDRGRPSKTQSAFRVFLRAIGFYSDIIKGTKALDDFIRHHVTKDSNEHPG